MSKPSTPAQIQAQRRRSRKWYDENRARAIKTAREWRLSHPSSSLVTSARRRALNKGLPFSLRPEDVVIPDVCPALGIPLRPGAAVVSDNSPSLDRLRPERGYVVGNVNVISKLANQIKTNATPDQLEAVARWLRKELNAT